jgi:hypothetical protein
MSPLLVFNEVYRLEIQSFMLKYSTQFVNCCPSNLLSGSTLPPPLPPSLCQSKYSSPIYRQCVAGKGGGGVESCWRPYSAGLYLTRFRIYNYKIAKPPKTKTQEGRGIRQINTYRKVPLQVIFFR